MDDNTVIVIRNILVWNELGVMAVKEGSRKLTKTTKKEKEKMIALQVYLSIGLLYSMILLYEAFTTTRPRNREYWVGIVIMGTLFWWIDMIVGNVGYIHSKFKLK